MVKMPAARLTRWLIWVATADVKDLTEKQVKWYFYGTLVGANGLLCILGIIATAS